MASAKKCDICGKLYDYPICNDAVTIHMNFGYLGGNKSVDLCNDCYNRLCDFVKPIIPEGYSVKRRQRSDETNERSL